MGKLVHDNVLDAALNYIKNNCDQISVCADTPTTYALATTAGNVRLALKTGLTSTDYTGPADDTSGRKLSINQHALISVANSGTATHIALTRSGTSELSYVTTCTAQELTSGNTVTIPSWTISISDPT